MQPMLRQLALGAALAASFSTSHAAVLGTFDFATSYDIPIGPEPGAPPYLVVHFGYSLAPNGLTDPGTLVFDGLQLDAASAGQTFSLNSAADDPQYPDFLARATNGVVDDARYDAIGKDGGGLGLVDFESNFFSFAPGLTGPDFHGALITGLELFIGSLAIDANAGPGEEAWSIAGRLRVVGEFPAPVPLPAGVWLLGAVLPWLVAPVTRRRNGSRA